MRGKRDMTRRKHKMNLIVSVITINMNKVGLPTQRKDFPGSSVVKNPPANPGDVGDVGWIPGSGRSSEGGNGNPLQYSCLENPMHIGVWWTTAHRVPKRVPWGPQEVGGLD